MSSFKKNGANNKAITIKKDGSLRKNSGSKEKQVERVQRNIQKRASCKPLKNTFDGFYWETEPIRRKKRKNKEEHNLNEIDERLVLNVEKKKDIESNNQLLAKKRNFNYNLRKSSYTGKATSFEVCPIK